jgi:hypothetical protein
LKHEREREMLLRERGIVEEDFGVEVVPRNFGGGWRLVRKCWEEVWKFLAEVWKFGRGNTLAWSAWVEMLFPVGWGDNGRVFSFRDGGVSCIALEMVA